MQLTMMGALCHDRVEEMLINFSLKAVVTSVLLEQCYRLVTSIRVIAYFIMRVLDLYIKLNCHSLRCLVW